MEEHGDNPAPLVENLAEFHVENVMGKNTRDWPNHDLINTRLNNIPIPTQSMCSNIVEKLNLVLYWEPRIWCRLKYEKLNTFLI